MSAASLEQLVKEVDEAKNLGELFFKTAKAHRSKNVYSQAVFDSANPEAERKWQTSNYQTVSNSVARVAAFLKSKGVKKGDSVAIISFTRPEWLIADLAIVSIGAISVSVYHSLNKNESGYILFDSGAKVVFAENQEQVDKVMSLAKEEFAIPQTEDREAQNVKLSFDAIISFEKTLTKDVSLLREIVSDTTLDADMPAEVDSISRDDVASFVYTSGTTGPPKGVVQTHGNHLANIAQAAETRLFAPTGDIFLFLPLAHSFAKLIGFIGFLTPTTLRFPCVADRQSSVLKAAVVLEDLRNSGAQVVPTVPRILEKMEAAVVEKSNGTSLRAKFISATLSACKRRFERESRGKSDSFVNSLAWKALTPIRKKIVTELFGTGFMHAISGGAKLATSVHTFFASLGIEIYEGYGLTETCVATNVNQLGDIRIGSVGPALRDIELRIAENDEILFRGPNITSGYHNRPTATSNSWDKDGWFHTGDTGRLDDDGYLYITGRIKELIVTAGGKKVAPQPIEEKLQSSPYISQGIVYGEGQPFCIALIAIDSQAVNGWFQRRGEKAPADLYSSQVVQKLIDTEVARINETLSRFETIKKVFLLPTELTVENGLLTPSFKIKKNVVFDEFKNDFLKLYE